MGGREYLGCLLALAALCLLAGAPLALVVGVVFWKLVGAFIILGALAVAILAVIGGGTAIASWFDRRRNGPTQP